MAAEQLGGRIVVRLCGYTISFPTNCPNIRRILIQKKGKRHLAKGRIFR